MENIKKHLPTWVYVIVVIQIVLVTFFSLGTAMNPGDFIPGVSELNYVTMLYITRNLTIVIGLIIALLIKSRKALLALLSVRIITDIIDVYSVFAFDVEIIKSSVPMVIVILILPAIFAVNNLRKKS